MSDRSVLIDELVRDEGLRLKVYNDSLGIPTIGIGRNLRDKGLSKREAYDLLDHDLDECVADLATFPWFMELDGVRQRALVNLRFNLGPKGLRGFKRMLAAFAAKDYGKAAASLRDSKWYTQVQASRSSRILHHVLTGAEV